MLTSAASSETATATATIPTSNMIDNGNANNINKRGLTTKTTLNTTAQARTAATQLVYTCVVA